ncbi:RnfABCDGE type electron transport complex subunit D [Planktothrix sp. FACHB-1355]|uniref:RnfABCDGE type electron transport complex subunit D n=1 Tax=Aerosakkonema funiforme FACHB-1375 TaxID=2949571 RepID=A0A926VBH9_9CYAN|nr:MULTISPECIES: RnfABCDGE type electron transport complex subunit D [Oscillatoriales]MBD2179534.1 RnfABCDGE type electron transport complex subunit D [Aerosakkonema funiforme FACHB-1375]MBD3561177.1 RnfABCDGE type electron transport complex subunit D [Planktothrix sp. FACHB-1355]
MLLKDIRDYQILFLSLFLILGIGTRDWTLRPELIVVAIVTCLVTQWLAERATSIAPHLKQNIANLLKRSDNYPHQPNLNLINPQKSTSLRSAAITALSLSLLLRTEHYSTMILAASLAILSKFIFQIHHKHFFNPANFGIIAAITFTKDAWVSPGQWGEDWWYALLFLGTGGMILKRVGRWDTTAAFLGSYALLEAIRNLWLGWTWDVYFHKLMSGSLLLFALFMITDPRSIPNAKISRLLWAASIALLTFILRNYFFLSTAVFWALFALAPLTIILDYLWTAPKFSWSFVKSNLSFSRRQQLTT